MFWLSFDPLLDAGSTGITVLIEVVIFNIGILLPADEVDLIVRRWLAVVSGTAIQYSSMPLLA